MTGEVAQARAPTANAGGKLGRADAAANLTADEGLDDAVLQRVEADDDEAAAGGQNVHRAREGGLQAGELVVDGDAQGLEGACSGVDAAGVAGDALRDNPASALVL